MTLLVFAHRPEAIYFMESSHWLPVTESAFQLFTHKTEKKRLLITGEGLDKALISTSSVLTQFDDIETVINLGVCGLLKDHGKDLKQESVYPLRTVYAEGFNGQLQHRSFTLQSANLENSVDCISASQRVLDKKFSWDLSHHAPLVDREVWAIANACQQFKIPLYSYKLISDIAGQDTNCLDIRTQAQTYSEKLYQNYQLQHSTESPKKSDLSIQLPQSFHSTHSQKERLKKLLSSLKLQITNTENFLSEQIEKVNIQELSPKQKTNLLLQELQDHLSPFTRKIKKELKTQTQNIEENKNLSVHFSQGLESENFQIHLKITSTDRFHKDLETLKKLDVKTIQDILLGQWDDRDKSKDKNKESPLV